MTLCELQTLAANKMWRYV